MKVFLSSIANLSLVGAIAVFTKQGAITVFYWPIIANLACNIVALGVHTAYGAQLTGTSKGITNSSAAIAAVSGWALGLSVIIALSLEDRGKTLGWFGVVFAAILLILERLYNLVYDSIFNKITLPTLILIFLKVHGISDISWWWVFIFVRIAAWTFLVVFGIVAIISVVCLFLKIAGKLRAGLGPLLVIFVSVMMVTIASTLLCFALPNYFNPEDDSVPWTGVGLYSACIIYICLVALAALVMFIS